MNDPDKNFFNNKFLETDSPYFFFENFNIFLRQLTEKTFSSCHYNVKSLSKNIDKLKDFLASLNGIFRERERDRYRETDRQTDRETESRETDRQTDRETDRQRDRETERQTDRQRQRKTERDRETQRE